MWRGRGRGIVNIRIYGSSPFSAAVLHGGSGAPGEMAPVARELAASMGVLEPMQTEASIKGQVRELQAALRDNGDIPLTLIGWSWGATLAFIFAARHPTFIKKLILIGSAPFEAKYAAGITATRLNRMDEEARVEVLARRL
ncbi:alpha/beta fold hydrolase [Chloroflexota bacterium]